MDTKNCTTNSQNTIKYVVDLGISRSLSARYMKSFFQRSHENHDTIMDEKNEMIMSNMPIYCVYVMALKAESPMTKNTVGE